MKPLDKGTSTKPLRNNKRKEMRYYLFHLPFFDPFLYTTEQKQLQNIISRSTRKTKGHQMYIGINKKGEWAAQPNKTQKNCLKKKILLSEY